MEARQFAVIKDNVVVLPSADTSHRFGQFELAPDIRRSRSDSQYNLHHVSGPRRWPRTSGYAHHRQVRKCRLPAGEFRPLFRQSLQLSTDFVADLTIEARL
jgi:hypothetical protein